jgi:cobalt-zinc-cadmium efflux system protein
LAALINAVVLLVTVGILGYESFTRLLNPEEVSGGVIACVAAIGIVINSITAFLFFRQKHELNSRAAYTKPLTS